MNDHQSDCTIYCRNCGREKNVSIAWLRMHFETLKEATNIKKVKIASDIRRLKCAKCGEKEAALVWHSSPPVVRKPPKVRHISSTKPYKQISKPKKKTFTKQTKQKAITGTSKNTKWQRQDKTDDAVAIKQRNRSMLQKQNDYKQRTSAKYRNRPDIIVIHSDDD